MNPELDQETIDAHLALFNGNVLKENLTKAALYVLAFELLKNTIVERLRGFYSLGEADAYRTGVLSLNRSPFLASCQWFQEHGALTPDEVRDILALRDHRNEIAHELPKVLLTPKKQVDEAKLSRALELLCKVDRWWIAEIEIPTGEDFDEADEEAAGQAFSGNVAFLAYLIQQVYSPTVEAATATEREA